MFLQKTATDIYEADYSSNGRRGRRCDSLCNVFYNKLERKEVSTLNEVKKRLGLDTDSEEDVTPTPDPSDSADPTQAPDDSDNTADPTQAPDPDDNNNNR